MYAEVVLTDRHRNYPADRQSLGVFPKPNHQMADYVSRELSRGAPQIPSHTPYIVPGLSERPWHFPANGRGDSLTRWRGIRQASTNPRNIPPLPFTARALYRGRLIFTADICDGASFGGAVAHRNSLPAALNIAASDSAQSALLYDFPLSNRL